MRKFKHKWSDFILKTTESGLTLDMYDCEDNMICKWVPQSMVILGNDWIEIKEEDNRIEKVVQDCKDNDLFALWKIWHRSIINKSINKHLPRITDDMIEKMIQSVKVQERWDTCPRGKSINEALLAHIIKQNLPKDLLANPE